MNRAAIKTDQNDPFPYRGLLRRADGSAPFNNYFWPTEGWAFSSENPGHHVDYIFRVEVISLADGRVATYGATYCIEDNCDPWGKPCVYPTRDRAIRVSAARVIKLCRRAARGRWSYSGLHRAPEIIAWARHVVERETGRASKTIAPFKMPTPPAQPEPKPDYADLPLFAGVA